jgi:carbonic anhydrase/acetyltransferase-like protein (isoleucine patch superfamily)
VQDCSVLHTDMGAPLTIGKDVTIGHQVMLHGCTIADTALIGIKATVLNHAMIPSFCLVGAHSLVTERKTYEEGSLITGAPARAMRKLEDQQRQIIQFTAHHYVENWRRYRSELKRSRFE